MRNRRQSWIDENGPCIDCGSTENLEVDHVNAKTKQYNPAQIWSRRKDVRDAELIKCVVRCNSCHVLKTKNNKEHSHGVNHGIAKVNVETVKELRIRYAREKVSIRSLAKEYNLGRGTVHDILRNVTWSHVD